MKVLVVSNELKETHKELINKTAGRIKAGVCFSDSEDLIPDDYADAPDECYLQGIDFRRMGSKNAPKISQRQSYHCAWNW